MAHSIQPCARSIHLPPLFNDDLAGSFYRSYPIHRVPVRRAHRYSRLIPLPVLMRVANSLQIDIKSQNLLMVCSKRAKAEPPTNETNSWFIAIPVQPEESVCEVQRVRNICLPLQETLCTAAPHLGHAGSRAATRRRRAWLPATSRHGLSSFRLSCWVRSSGFGGGSGANMAAVQMICQISDHDSVENSANNLARGFLSLNYRTLAG